MMMDDSSVQAAETISSDRQATEIFLALRYWARATRYEPTPGERDVMRRGDQRSNIFWKMGAAVGGAGGIGLASLRRVPWMHRLAIGAATASMGSFYATFMANKPCMNELLEHGRHAESPLARQAHRILRDGGAATIEELQREALEAARRRRSVPAAGAGSMEGGHADELPMHAHRGLATSPHAADALEPACLDDGGTPPPSASQLGGGGSGGGGHGGYDGAAPNDGLLVGAEAGGAAAPTDSWEAVRQRYRARTAGLGVPADFGSEPDAASHLGQQRGLDEEVREQERQLRMEGRRVQLEEERLERLEATRHRQEEMQQRAEERRRQQLLQAQQPARRVRRNAYGDEEFG